MVIISQMCDKCGETRIWCNSPYIEAVPSCNLLLSGAILFSGGLPGKILKFLRFFGAVTYSHRTYFRLQKAYLCPAVQSIWQNEIAAIQQEIRKNQHYTVIGGDACCDSMGHSAKYGSYTFVELGLNKVLDLELVQSNEVGSSYHMEQEGLKRIMNRMKENSINISAIVTDGYCNCNQSKSGLGRIVKIQSISWMCGMLQEVLQKRWMLWEKDPIALL
ncbi:uncharacterized protein LOC135690186 [Rhopilema esculentum]|uniref:uncharacterized protein LOC135690186 n=1 Tax=Rhopilema esculentum TaxID=499914 RepID=UPI0031D774F9